MLTTETCAYMCVKESIGFDTAGFSGEVPTLLKR